MDRNDKTVKDVLARYGLLGRMTERMWKEWETGAKNDKFTYELPTYLKYAEEVCTGEEDIDQAYWASRVWAMGRIR